LHGDGFCWTVPGTGPAFHAGITVFNPGMPVVHTQDRMRANKETQAAARAFSLVEGQRSYIQQINEFTHINFFLVKNL
jgi:hypothetical protein